MIEERIYAAGSILVVGAHAFDAEVIAGPLAAVAAKRGAERNLPASRRMGEQGHPACRPPHYAVQKQQEAARAAERLGVAWRKLRPARRVPARRRRDRAQASADVIRELRPEAVITHWHGSWHKDHRAAAELTHDRHRSSPRCRRSSAPRRRTRRSLVLFGENWEDDEGFSPGASRRRQRRLRAWREAVHGVRARPRPQQLPLCRLLQPRFTGCAAACGARAHAQGFAAASHSWNAGGRACSAAPPAAGRGAAGSASRAGCWRSISAAPACAPHSRHRAIPAPVAARAAGPRRPSSTISRPCLLRSRSRPGPMPRSSASALLRPGWSRERPAAGFPICPISTASILSRLAASNRVASAVGNDAQFALLAEASAGAARGTAERDPRRHRHRDRLGGARRWPDRSLARMAAPAPSAGPAPTSNDAGEERLGWLERVASGRALDAIGARPARRRRRCGGDRCTRVPATRLA